MPWRVLKVERLERCIAERRSVTETRHMRAVLRARAGEGVSGGRAGWVKDQHCHDRTGRIEIKQHETERWWKN